MCYTHFHDDFESLRTVNPPEHNLPAVLLHDITWLIFDQNTDFLAVQSISAKILFAISTNSWVERAFQKPKCQSDLHPSHGINYSAILIPSKCMVKVAHQITHCIVESAAPDWALFSEKRSRLSLSFLTFVVGGYGPMVTFTIKSCHELEILSSNMDFTVILVLSSYY